MTKFRMVLWFAIAIMLFVSSCSDKATSSLPSIAIHGIWTGMQNFGYGEKYTTIEINDEVFNFFYESGEIQCAITQFDNEACTGVFQYVTYSDSYLIEDYTQGYPINLYRKFTWTEDGDDVIILQLYPEKAGEMEALAETSTEVYPPVTYTKAEQCDTPDFSRSTGQYDAQVNVTISCKNDGATIRFTTNGKEPDGTSPIYASAVSFSASGVLKAKAFLAGHVPSKTAVATYYIGTNSSQEEMVHVTGDTFNMGSNSYHPIHQVTLSDYYIGKYEITQKEYKRIMGNNPALGKGVGDFFPVYSVSMFNAIEYCNKRSIMEGLNPCYTFTGYGTDTANWPNRWDDYDFSQTLISCDWNSNGYRLPSEAEWEFAARGGQLSQGYEYSGSDNMHEAGWYRGNSSSLTHIVGQKLGNELGLFDMSGNCSEFVWDVASTYYTADAQVNPHGGEAGGESFRVLRGGCFSFTAQYTFGNWGRGCTVADRFGVPPKNNAVLNGFRVCRTTL